MNNSAFNLLDPRLQEWIYRQGWANLREIQQLAIEPILQQRDDIIISASTASGKTEAAFLPAITKVLQQEKPGLRILYISPLKALINDQYRRLQDIADLTGVTVTPWHGDVSSSQKTRLFANPRGIVLITPESLESLLLNHLTFIKTACANLDYIIIDEFHAFIGRERGFQLQSQLHRIENLIKRSPVRIGISATFANFAAVAHHLRPNNHTGMKCRLIRASEELTTELLVQIRGYAVNPLSEEQINELKAAKASIRDEELKRMYVPLAHDLFRLLRGKNHLVFANSRAETEAIAADLRMQCEYNHVPNEFFPHHGSLSKDIRQSLEERLKNGRLPTTAICTSTLELGIDIADVQSIGQVRSPDSVASLRQRLGRSGRRDGTAVLRIFVPEEINSNHMGYQLCEDTCTSCAMIDLLLHRWYEEPNAHDYAFSTLTQQVLSVISSAGAIGAKPLYTLLCKTGPFALTTPPIFAALLRSLGSAGLIRQMSDGSLILDHEGEQITNKWSFTAAFHTPEEYVIEYNNTIVGRIPMTGYSLAEGSHFTFAGRAWQVIFISDNKRTIGVKPYSQKALSLTFNGGAGQICDHIREKMLHIYLTGEHPNCLSKVARENLERGREAFFGYHLDKTSFVENACGIFLFPWAGDKVMHTISLLLMRDHINCNQSGAHIEINQCSMDNLKALVGKILRTGPDLSANDMNIKTSFLREEKFDEYLSEDLLRLRYGQCRMDIPGALKYFKRLAHEL